MMIDGLKRFIFGEGKRGLYIGDFAYELSRTRNYSLRQGIISPYKNLAASWMWRRKGGKLVIDLSREPNPHMLIVGSSGYGKSTLLKRVLHEIEEHRMPAILLDAHNEHEGIIREVGGKVYDAVEHGINIFALDGLDVRERADSLARLLADVYGLGYLQEFSLRQCMNYMYRKAYNRIEGRLERVPKMHDLIHEIDIFIANSKSASETNRLKHIRSRISLLEGKSFFGDSKGVGSLMESVSSFSLAGIHSEEAKTIYIHELLERLYRSMKRNEKENGVRLYLIIDEGDFLVEKGYQTSGVMAKLIAEGRKYGLGVIIAAHSASALRSEIAGNMSTIVSFRPREPSDINYISNIMSEGDKDKADAIRMMLGRLSQHSAMLVNYTLRAPVVFRGNRFLPDSTSIKKAEGRAGIDNFIVIESRRPMKLEALEKSVKGAFGDAGLDEVKRLLEAGALKSFDAEDGTWIGIKPNPGLEHEVMLLKIAGRLHELGVKYYVMDNPNNPDIAINYKGMRIALEYETSKKNLNETSGMLSRRLSAYDAVIVVTNAQGYGKYKWMADSLGSKIHVHLFKEIGLDLLNSIIP